MKKSCDKHEFGKDMVAFGCGKIVIPVGGGRLAR